MRLSEREERHIRALAEAQGMPSCEGYEMREGWVEGRMVVTSGGPTAQRRIVRWEWTVEFGWRKYAVGYDPIAKLVAYADPSVARAEAPGLPGESASVFPMPEAEWALAPSVGLLARWIEWRISQSWITAGLATHREISGDGFYLIQEGDRTFWLIVRHRVFRSMRMFELAGCLDQMNWLERLRTDQCVAVELTGIRPMISRVANLVA